MALKVLVASAALGAFIGQVQTQLPPTDAKVLEAKVDDLLAQAYMRDDVARYCSSNADSVYVVELNDRQGHSITLTVRCRSWWEWKKQTSQ